MSSSGNGRCAGERCVTSCESVVVPSDVSGTIGATNSTSDGLLVFTMDPNTYEITVSSTSPGIPVQLFEADPQLSGGITGTIDTPVAASSGMTQALRKRSRTVRR